jgi:uncharacterized membrane protein
MNHSLSRRWRLLALILMGTLVALIFAWQLLPSASARGVFNSVLLCIPVLLPLYGVARSHRYTYRWATLCVMPYIVVGLTEVIANPTARAWSAAMLVVSLALFVSLIGFLRVSKPV